MNDRTIAHYHILEKLGEGGMGVVYKARDEHLDRLVAIKVLRDDAVSSPDRRRRFVQEAKAASALNHPNIITIHDIDTDAGSAFISMEYVKGQSLDRLIPRKGMPLPEALRCAVQVAGALAAAHAKGIVHRDLKPANIMLAADGQVKVLDFGLAKLTEPEPDEFQETRTIAQEEAPATDDRVIVGTTAYMSPEQTQAKPVDARSDIFSFGAVLYEMVTGRRAFQGETRVSTLAAILQKDPPPFDKEIPHDLEKLIARCLRKEANRRFQHAADLKVALEELKEESDSGALTTVAAPPRPRRRRLVWLAITAVILLAGMWLLFPRKARHLAPRVTLLTGIPGMKLEAAISPDGRQVAFVVGDENEQSASIYVQLLDEVTPRRLTTSPGLDFSPVWSPDGLRIAFLRQDSGGSDILITPSGGGQERKLYRSSANCGSAASVAGAQRGFCGIAWSPDGKSLAIVDKEAPAAPNSIFLLNIETREKRKLTSPPAGWYGDGQSAFSPDGRNLAFMRIRSPYPSDIYLLRISESGEPRGEPRRVTFDNASIAGVEWTSDGRSLVYSSSRAGLHGLWRVSASGGESERLAVGSESAVWPSVSARGNRLVYAQTALEVNIWRVAGPGAGPSSSAPGAPTKIVYAPPLNTTPAVSEDGRRLAFSRTLADELWVADTDGANQNRLVHLQSASRPQWSPDGHQLVFRARIGTETFQLYTVDAEGGPPRRITDENFDHASPSWSHDGKWIYYHANRGSGNQVWKMPFPAGPAVQVTRNGGSSPLESFDGQFVYCLNRGQIWKIPVAGGAEMPLLEKGARALWALAKAGICILDPDAEGGPSIRFLSFETGKSADVMKLPKGPRGYISGLASTLAISPDARWIFYEQTDRLGSDIVLVEDFQ